MILRNGHSHHRSACDSTNWITNVSKPCIYLVSAGSITASSAVGVERSVACESAGTQLGAQHGKGTIGVITNTCKQ
jgi:hypothetical protein